MIGGPFEAPLILLWGNGEGREEGKGGGRLDTQGCGLNNACRLKRRDAAEHTCKEARF